MSDPRLSVQILRARPQTYRRATPIGSAFDGMGIAGVFSAEGSAWRPQRRLTMEALSQRHLRSFFPTLHTVGERLLRRLQAAADDGQAIDIVEQLKRFTVDVTTLLTFGYDINTIEQSGTDIIQRRLETVFPVLSRRAFAAVPLWKVIRLPSDRRFDRAIAELRVWMSGPIEEARAQIAAWPQRPPTNFLQAMLLARDDAGRPFTEQMIFGNLMNMLLAGEDTTAYTLAWAVHHLSDSSPAQASLRDELEGALGPDRIPQSFEATDRLAYASAIATEAMRLRPVAPLIFLQTIVDTALEDVSLPAGTLVLVATRPAVLEPERFGEPARFRPERWLDITGTAPHDPSAHFPFGSGPRVCPGRSLALLEMKLALATLYKNFDITREGESAEVQEVFSFTMLPRGLRVRLTRRS